MILEGKNVIVCGVGPGLGGEVARLALRDGAKRQSRIVKVMNRRLSDSGNGHMGRGAKRGR